MDYKKMFDTELIDLNIQAEDEQQAFEIVAKKLAVKDLVTKSYCEGISEREKEFPTGLITQYLNIGLPHSDPQYIKQPFIFIARLKDPVNCLQMGDNQEIQVRDLFFLGIKEGKEQVGLLQIFMDLFMNEEFVRKYKTSKTKNEIYQLFIDHI